MIGRLAGKVVSKQAPGLILDVNGVGYEVDAPMSTFYVLPEPGEPVVLLIHTNVREDAIHLYGFATEAERALFRTLIKISGIGPRLALTILSGIEVGAFIRCVQSADESALVRLPGVGKKTAQRLLVEMKDKLEGIPVAFAAAPALSAAGTPVEEAVTALISLGYKPVDASRMITAVERSGASTEELIRMALKAAMK
ncbi:MAG TPA: Holliday junction branch migration protein RuvA [Gammaproteobacteria bacterium]|nr:Holliday junction branch migration protein RuvA [Gammaproteobacteria bacterium]